MSLHLYLNLQGIIANIDAMVTATNLSFSAPGSWNDADMLQVCNYGTGRTPGGGMTLAEYRAHYAVWAVLASPLILGNDLRSIAAAHPACLKLLLNADIVKVNQDSGGFAPRLVWQHPPPSTVNITSPEIRAQAIARPLSGGRVALLMLNRGASAISLATTWEQLGVGSSGNSSSIRGSGGSSDINSGGKMQVYDVIAQHDAGTAVDKFSAVVPSHDVSFVVLTPVQK
jgi:alpha-galactosidase